MSNILNGKSHGSVILMTDFSDNARNATQFAVSTFGADADYTLINAYSFNTSGITMVDLTEIVREGSVEQLHEEKHRLEAIAIPLIPKIDLKSINGTPVDAINLCLEQCSHSIVVMGSRGISGYAGRLVGRTSLDIIQKSKIPVLAIPAGVLTDSIKNIALAHEPGKKLKAESLEPLFLLKNKLNAKLNLISVAGENPVKVAEQLDTSFKNEIDETTSLNGINREDILLEYCRDNQIDLLAVVAQHKGFIDKLFKYSVNVEPYQDGGLPILVLNQS